MRAQLVPVVTGGVALLLAVTGCSSDGTGDDGSGEGTTGSKGASTSREAQPSDTTRPIKDAALAAGSVVVTRTTRSDGAEADIIQEEIEVELTEPMSGRVLHVGDEIWTLDVVGGVGYLKDQTEKKSTNRWTKLSAAETTKRLEDVTLDGLLGVLDDASEITSTEKATVAGGPATCHSMTLEPSTDGDDGPVPQSARVCVDGDRRPVELVVTADGEVATSSFTEWGVAIEAMAPPSSLVDGQG